MTNEGQNDAKLNASPPIAPAVQNGPSGDAGARNMGSALMRRHRPQVWALPGYLAVETEDDREKVVRFLGKHLAGEAIGQEATDQPLTARESFHRYQSRLMLGVFAAAIIMSVFKLSLEAGLLSWLARHPWLVFLAALLGCLACGPIIRRFADRQSGS